MFSLIFLGCGESLYNLDSRARCRRVSQKDGVPVAPGFQAEYVWGSKAKMYQGFFLPAESEMALESKPLLLEIDAWYTFVGSVSHWVYPWNFMKGRKRRPDRLPTITFIGRAVKIAGVYQYEPSMAISLVPFGILKDVYPQFSETCPTDLHHMWICGRRLTSVQRCFLYKKSHC